jgi:hypothetical protein
MGIFRFENRDKYSKAPYNTAVWTIEPDDIINWKQELNSQIINRAIIKGAPRSVKGETEVWRDGVEEEVAAGTTVTVWAQFDDPVSSLTSPVATTDYTAYTATGGGGSDITADVDITLTSFTTTAKLEITNNNASKAYVNLLKLRGAPATVDYEITEVYQDDDSVEEYNEHQQEVGNEFIDNRTFAKSMAKGIVKRHKDTIGVLKLTVRGLPQLQLRDQVRIKDNDLGTYKNYRLIGIQGVYEPGSFIQNLTLREVTSNESQ